MNNEQMREALRLIQMNSTDAELVHEWATKALASEGQPAQAQPAEPKAEPVAFCEADLEAIARKLLADEYEKHGVEGSYPTYANLARNGRGEFTLRSIRAIVAALKYTHPPAEMVRLTDEEISQVMKAEYCISVAGAGVLPFAFAKAIQNAMIAKNGGK